MSTALPNARWYHVGPHGYFDLVRLARSGRSSVVRVVYIVALLGALALSFYTSVPPDGRDRAESLNWNARIAERFSVTVLVVQNIAVLVLTPMYMTASIQEERDKKTFPLLFTTHLSSHEIIVGKWLSRCAQVGIVLLAGLPVLGAAQLWGGVDMSMIAANFLNTGMLLLTVGAFSLWVTLLEESMLVGLFKTYAALTGMLLAVLLAAAVATQRAILWLMPFGGGANGYMIMWDALAVLGFGYAAITVWMLRFATKQLRDFRRERTPPPKPEPGISPRRNRFWRWPAVTEAIVAWKECYLDRTVWHTLPYAIAILLILLLFAVSVAEWLHGPSHDLPQRMRETAAIIALGSVGAFVLMVTLRLTGCIVRERQQRTLETILTIPILSREFLWQKIIGNLRRQTIWLVPASLAWGLLLYFGRDRIVVGLVLPMACLVHLTFFAMLGLYLSVTCRSTLSAYVALGLILAVFLFGMPIFSAFIGLPSRLDTFQRLMNPLTCWPSIATGSLRPGSTRGILMLFGSLLLYIAGAWSLWLMACRRFARDPVGREG